MVEKIGIEGMSTDYSDEDPRVPMTVVHKEWRSHAVIGLLQYVDENRELYNKYGNHNPGGSPHERIRVSGHVSARKAIGGLPINFYHPTWYNNLTTVEKRDLQPAAALPIEHFVVTRPTISVNMPA